MRHESSLVVNRPIEEVWAFWSDPFNIPRLIGSTLGVRPTPPGQHGPIGVGTSFQMRLRILGVETRATAAVTEWDPPHALAFSGSGAGMLAFSSRQTLEATADGTKVVRVAEIEPRPALKPLWWILAPLFRRRLDAEMQKLKRLLEADRG